jgi:putative heme-binding domain-containing protein
LLKLGSGKSADVQAEIVAGITKGLRGWTQAPKPGEWDAFQAVAQRIADAGGREKIRGLNVIFGDGRALEEVKEVVLNKTNELSLRKAALETLIQKRPPDLRQICEQLLDVRFLNSTAVRGLALFDDPAIGVKLAENYKRFHFTERGPVVDTLVSRASFAKAFLEEMAAGRIARADLTAFHARQIRGFNDPALTKRLAEVWGELRDSPAEKREAISKWKTRLTAPALAKADKGEGRKAYDKTCAACHILYGHGGQVGPDLTGSGRDNLDYLLENIVDPSAVVNADFRMTIVQMKDGRNYNGIVAAKTEKTITLKTMTETITVERTEIEQLRESPLSLMPEGLLETLTENQVTDLVAYLMNRTQVSLK